MEVEFHPPKPQKKMPCAELLQDVQKITHKGYLNMLNNYSVLKYSKKVGVFTWDNKYAVIHNGCMYVYSDVQAKKPTVAISLYGYNKVIRESDPKVVGNMTNSFKLEPVQPVMKTFYFSLPSEKERREWMAKLKQAMLYANGKVSSMITRVSPHSISMGSVEESVYTDADEFQTIPSKSSGSTPDSGAGPDFPTDGMGHTMNIERTYYRVMSSTIEKAKIAKLLLLAENGTIDRFLGKKLEDIEFETLPIPEQGTQEEETTVPGPSNKKRKLEDVHEALAAPDDDGVPQQPDNRHSAVELDVVIPDWTDETRDAYEIHIRPYLQQYGRMPSKSTVSKIQVTTALKNIGYHKIKNKMNADLQKMRRKQKIM